MDGADQIVCGGRRTVLALPKKEAIKSLVNSGKLVYTYFGGSFLEIPHKEGAAND